MNSFEEIARLKNLVAEKVKVIAVMEKERTAMQKLHRQYQKERTDQDSLENEYGERMRRVNEDLRVAKGALLLPHSLPYSLPRCIALACAGSRRKNAGTQGMHARRILPGEYCQESTARRVLHSAAHGMQARALPGASGASHPPGNAFGRPRHWMHEVFPRRLLTCAACGSPL